MIKSYFTIAFRNLRRNGRYLVINVAGLGIALAFCILAYLNKRFADSYDTWHRDAARIVRVETVKATTKERYGVCPAALGPAAAADLHGVEAMCRLDSRPTVVKRGDQVFNEHIHFADENFFQFFDFELLSGSLDLSDRSKVVIDEEMALKYFGKENPIGQSLLFFAETEQRKNLTVGGVVKKVPLNSSIHFEMITHLDNQYDGAKLVDYRDWNYMVDAVFLRLKNASDEAAVQTSLQAYVGPRNAGSKGWTLESYYLDPLLNVAADSRSLLWNNLWNGMPPAAIWGNIILSALLLLTAALNFANMTIAVCNRRLREMGVRKVMGGTRFQLMRQLLSESFVVVALASVLAMILAYPLCDWYNATWKFTDLQMHYKDPALLGYIAAAALFTTLLAGAYPAFYVSGFKPANIFRGGVLFGGSNMFSRIMMGLQVSISIIGVVVSLSFARNAEYNRRADIGFDYQPILQAWLPQAADYKRFDDAVREIPGVTATAGSMHLMGFGATNIEFGFQGQTQESGLYEVGNDFMNIMHILLEQGAWPAPAGDTIASQEVVVNQTFVRSVGGNKPVVGEQLDYQGRKLRISGVVADFMTNRPFMAIRPTILHPIPLRDCRRCIIRTANVQDQPRIMEAIEQKWKALFPYIPFNVGYQSEMMKEGVEVSSNIARTMAVFAAIAVLLSITGLFSLVSLNILRRLREVAIRRVMGASSGHVTWILNKNYLGIFGFAVVVGCLAGRILALSLMDSIFVKT
ncbi:MAG: FtsX-like permease family protein [Bacteroidota bacterium]